MFAFIKFILLSSFFLLLAGCTATTSWMTRSQMNQEHISCGFGTAPIPDYRSCLVRVYTRDYGISENRMRFLVMLDETAQSVRMGVLSLTKAYSNIAAIRSEDSKDDPRVAPR